MAIQTKFISLAYVTNFINQSKDSDVAAASHDLTVDQYKFALTYRSVKKVLLAVNITDDTEVMLPISKEKARQIVSEFGEGAEDVMTNSYIYSANGSMELIIRGKL